MLDKLKAWWPTISAALMAAFMAALPQLQVYVSTHPKAATVVAAAAVILSHLKQSPLPAEK